MRRLSLSLVLCCALPALAHAQPTTQPATPPKKSPDGPKPPAKGPEPPFTEADLRKTYKQGVVLRYGRATAEGGKTSRVLLFQQVVRTGEKGYLLQTMSFNDKGRLIEKKPARKAIPYKVFPEMFSSASRMQKGEIKVGGEVHPTIQYSYRVTVKGQPTWRHVWYSAKYRGLLVRSLLQPAGKFGRKNSVTLDLTQLPTQLAGGKLMTASQGQLPWNNDQIRAFWKPGMRAAYEATRSLPGKPAERLLIEELMLETAPYFYVRHDRVTDKASGKRLGASAVPRLWGTLLAQVRFASKDDANTVGKVETINAAGKDWRCRPYVLREGNISLTYYLADEAPGLTIKFVSKGPGGHVTRTLVSWGPVKK